MKTLIRVLIINLAFLLLTTYKVNAGRNLFIIGSYSFRNLCDMPQIYGFIKSVKGNENTVNGYRVIFLNYFENKKKNTFKAVIKEVTRYITKIKPSKVALINDVAFNSLINSVVRNSKVVGIGLNCSSRRYERFIESEYYQNLVGIVLETINIEPVLKISAKASNLKILIISSPIEVANISSCITNQIIRTIKKSNIFTYEVINVLTLDELRNKIYGKVSSLSFTNGLIIMAIPYLYDEATKSYVDMRKISDAIHDITKDSSLIIAPNIYLCEGESHISICVSNDLFSLGSEGANLLFNSENNDKIVKLDETVKSINFKNFIRNIYKNDIRIEDFEYVFGF